MPKDIPERMFLNLEEAADVCGVAPPTFQKMVDAGAIRIVQIEGMRRKLVPISELRKLAGEPA